MSIESRLALSDPNLCAIVRDANPEQRRRAAVAVARWIVARVGLANPAIDQAIKCVESGAPVKQADVAGIEQLVSNLDARYFDLSEEAEDEKSAQGKVLTAFGLARAAKCVLFASSGDVAEATYEAIVATDELSAVRNVVLSAMSVKN